MSWGFSYLSEFLQVRQGLMTKQRPDHLKHHGWLHAATARPVAPEPAEMAEAEVEDLDADKAYAPTTSPVTADEMAAEAAGGSKRTGGQGGGSPAKRG